MSRTRFAVDFLAPPAIASAWVVAVFCVRERSPEPIATLPLVLIAACLYAGAPSLLHALFMRHLYRRGVVAGGRRALLWSSASGLFAGALILVALVRTSGGWMTALGAWWLLPLGAVTGASTAMIFRLRRFYSP